MENMEVEKNSKKKKKFLLEIKLIFFTVDGKWLLTPKWTRAIDDYIHRFPPPPPPPPLG
jgi:hypothetical protein